MKATVLTIFPEMFPGLLSYSLAGKALDAGRWHLETVNIREYAFDKHRTVDDVPFGGGAGMVMKVDVLDKALQETYGKSAVKGPLIYFSPKGKPLTQKRVRELAKEEEITLLCGHFEGIDERVFDLWPIEQISIGDYILSGGETAAMVLLDAVVRLLPDTLGNKDSLTEESFENGLLEYPQYTRPADYKGHKVPEVLIGGHHGKIKEWCLEQSKAVTKEKRPDLYEAYLKNNEEKGNL
jgi:tRNA (guanine37-N1)-methyltransferase